MPTPINRSLSSVHLPSYIQLDDYHAADQARKRLAPKTSFFHTLLSHLRRSPERRTSRGGHQSLSRSPSKTGSDVSPLTASSAPAIKPDKSNLDDSEAHRDKFQWAILYENQRGMTLFSTPYYSHLSLLPTDPSPFTMPNASAKRSEQPNVSLSNYPLPDGTWRWVSKTWMIDMRGTTGEVQQDGFEYNWVFQKHKWRAHVGKLSAGGWVRRRRWIRLMMRPAQPRVEAEDDAETDADTHVTSRSASTWNGVHGWRYWHHRDSVTSTLPGPSSVVASDGSLDPDKVWLGDSVDEDWTRCRRVMRAAGRDGIKIEIWQGWLGLYHIDPHPHAYERLAATNPDAKGKGKEVRKQWTEDEVPLPSEVAASETRAQPVNLQAPLEHIVVALRKHGDLILRSFVYPESRAKFTNMLAHAGLLPQLGVGLGMGWNPIEVDFWSYASDLGNLTSHRLSPRENTG